QRNARRDHAEGIRGRYRSCEFFIKIAWRAFASNNLKNNDCLTQTTRTLSVVNGFLNCLLDRLATHPPERKQELQLLEE
ncbi:MAG: hypothetical protein KGQ60_12240, partial [Planctomycetes bacterium]|nr:hypothetical protein [Planctomycetota bacterium]